MSPVTESLVKAWGDFSAGFYVEHVRYEGYVLDQFCRQNGHSYVRFNYRGHGLSSGTFQEATIRKWKQDALAIIDSTEGPQVLVGSSIGAWVMLLAAMQRPDRIHGLVGIASAPDHLIQRLNTLPVEIRTQLDENGYISVPSQYSEEPYRLSKTLFEDALLNSVLDKPITLSCPVRLLHGMKDADVPYGVSMKLLENLSSDDVQLTLIKDGDHRLSKPQFLQAIQAAIMEVLSLETSVVNCQL